MPIKMIYVLIEHSKEIEDINKIDSLSAPLFPYSQHNCTSCTNNSELLAILQTQLYCLLMYCCPSTVSIV